MSGKARPNEIRIVREYDAPVETVWDAFADPKQVAQWWGPRGFTLTSRRKELRSGGFWDYTMHGPDGTDYPNWTIYHEVELHRKMVYDHGGNSDQPPLFRVTILFSESDGKTTMDMTMALPTAEQAAATRKMIKQAGGNSTWDRLAEFVGDKVAGRNLFVINRSFDAPKELLFDMWTNADHLAKWLPPTGLEMEHLRFEVGVGKSSFFKMSDGAGFTLYGRIEYKEVDRPCRLVYTQQFCDENEQPGIHPALPVWPPLMLTTIVLAEEGTDSTRVTVACEPYGESSAEEIKAFVDLRGGMTQGWTGSFDALESLITKV